MSFCKVQYLHRKGPDTLVARFIEVPANYVYVSVLVNVPDMFSNSFDQGSFGLIHIMFAACLLAQTIHYVVGSTCDLGSGIVLLVGYNTPDST